VALHKDDALLGTITVYRGRSGRSLDKQIALLQTRSAGGDRDGERAADHRTRSGLKQQTATARFAVINSSPGDLVPVFDAILE